jgi:hypothetical protein
MISNLLNSALRFLEGQEAPMTFQYQGQEFACVRSSEEIASVIDAHGNMLNVDLVLHVRRELFVTDQDTPIGSETIPPVDHWPVSGDTITYNNRDYKVITASEDGTRTFVRLALADPNSNQ